VTIDAFEDVRARGETGVRVEMALVCFAAEERVGSVAVEARGERVGFGEVVVGDLGEVGVLDEEDLEAFEEDLGDEEGLDEEDLSDLGDEDEDEEVLLFEEGEAGVVVAFPGDAVTPPSSFFFFFLSGELDTGEAVVLLDRVLFFFSSFSSFSFTTSIFSCSTSTGESTSMPLPLP